MSILNREAPVALAAFIHTLRKAMKPEGRFEQGYWAPTKRGSEYHLPRLEAVQEALDNDVITPYEAAKQTMQEISDWLEMVMGSRQCLHVELDAMRRIEMGEQEMWYLDKVDREMQWCWKQGERFAENSHWLCVEGKNPQAMIESGQNPWKPSTLNRK